MEIIHFTSDVDVTFSWADYFLLEERFAQGFNWKVAIGPTKTKSSLVGGADWVQQL